MVITHDQSDVSIISDFEVRFLHTAAVKCNHMCTCDRVRHQEEDGMIMIN